MPDKTKLESNLLIGGAAILAGYFFIVKPLLSAIGIDPADSNAIKDQALIDRSENCFSIQYAPAVALFNANPSYNADGSKMTMDQYYPAIRAAYFAGKLNGTGAYNIANWAEIMYGAIEGWHLTTDSDTILSAFAQLTNQIQVSDISAYMYYNFTIDFYSWLQGSLFKQGLSPSELATVVKQVNNLPAQ